MHFIRLVYTCLCFTFRPSANLKVEMPSQVSIHVILLLAYAQLLSRMATFLKSLADLECSQDESARHLESARIKLSSNVESIRGIRKLLRTKSLQDAHLPYCSAVLMVCACYVECIKYLLGKLVLNPNVDYALVKSEFNLGTMEPATSTDEWRSSTEKIHALFQVIGISLLSKSKPDQKDCQYFHQILVAIQTCIQLFPYTIGLISSDSETEVEYKHHTPSRCGQVSEREGEHLCTFDFFFVFLVSCIVSCCHVVHSGWVWHHRALLLDGRKDDRLQAYHEGPCHAEIRDACSGELACIEKHAGDHHPDSSRSRDKACAKATQRQGKYPAGKETVCPSNA